jgi:hypothetical protein
MQKREKGTLTFITNHGKEGRKGGGDTENSGKRKAGRSDRKEEGNVFFQLTNCSQLDL